MLNDFLISYQAAFIDHNENVKYYTYSCIHQYNPPMLTASDVKDFQIVMAASCLKYAPHRKDVKINILNIIMLS